MDANKILTEYIHNMDNLGASPEVPTHEPIDTFLPLDGVLKGRVVILNRLPRQDEKGNIFDDFNDPSPLWQIDYIDVQRYIDKGEFHCKIRGDFLRSYAWAKHLARTKKAKIVYGSIAKLDLQEFRDMNQGHWFWDSAQGDRVKYRHYQISFRLGESERN